MSKIHFEKLTPNKDIDLNTYEEALNFMFEDDEIKNIAITGSYSAGKSSVIESYKVKNKDKKFIHISLANFESDYPKNDNKESVLEGKILNQLLHQIDPSKIPQTNFKVKRTESNINVLKVTLMTIIFIICSLHIVYYSQWSKFVESLRQFYSLRFLLITTKSIGLLLSGSIIVALSTVALFKFIKMYKHKSIFKKLNLNGNEIEIFEHNDESYFDKYLNEVIYIFENSDADAIVFEDIDRYNTNEIFQRLREVNNLVNSRRIIQNTINKNNQQSSSRFDIINNLSIKIKKLTKEKDKKTLKFVYLVRDDIFISKDRTKFFDFIMPVVPVIDSSNSYEQFISHLKNGNMLDKFDKHFLQDISLYVDDMRILKNIYNEFIVYNNRIRTTEQDYNKLLAIIIYKNIFPSDFSDTQINIGYVSRLFEQKNNIIEESIKEIDIKIYELEDKINKCENEHINTIDELKKVYTDFDGYYHPRFDVNNKEYLRRKDNVDLKYDNKVDEIKYEINQLKQKREKIRNDKLCSLITRENIDEVFDIESDDFKNIKSSQYFDLIKYLIRNGHIDETYCDYMTYFYDNSLSRNDKMFLRSVTDKRPKAWTYEIDDSKLVISRLKEVDFDETEILNFDIFKKLIESPKYTNYLIRFIDQLRKKQNFKFISDYINSQPRYAAMPVEKINRYWTTFIEEMYTRPEFTYEQKKDYIIETLIFCNDEEINNVNNNRALTNIISSDKEFLNIELADIKNIIKKFIDLNIKFKTLDYEKSNKELFNAIYKNNLYDLNYENVRLMLKYIFKVKNEYEIRYRNYSKILENGESELLELVDKNIQEYIKLIIENCDGKVYDTQEASLKLINNDNLSLEDRQEYSKLLQVKLNYLKDIENKELWDIFLEYKKIKYSIENILTYYFMSGKKLNEVLIDFINSPIYKCEIIEEYIYKESDEESIQDLFISISSCEDIIEENYKRILEMIDFIYQKPVPKIEGLSKERIKILIELGKFEVTLENIQFLENKFNDLLEYFIELNIEEYIEQIEELPKLKKEKIMNLLSSNIEDKFKQELIYNFDGEISIVNIECSDDIKEYVIKNKFDKSDISYLINKYYNFDKSIKESIKELCIKYIDVIVDDDINLNYDLLINIMGKNSIEEYLRLELLINNADNVSKEQFRDAIEVTNLDKHKKVLNNGRPRLEVNDINSKFLEICINKNWISDFEEEDGLYKISRSGMKISSVS